MKTDQEKLLFMKEIFDKDIITIDGIKKYLKEQE